jgi:hypothetical protein
VHGENDTNGDGDPDFVTDSTYEGGLRLREDSDDDGDGDLDRRDTFGYDDIGNLVLVEHDAGADGSVEGQATYDYGCF